MRKSFHLIVTAALGVASSVGPLAAQQQSGTVAGATAADAIARGQLDGARAGEHVGTKGWLVGSYFSGLTLGLIGTGISWAVANGSDANVSPTQRAGIIDSSATYRAAFEEGFGEKVKSRRKASALTGGLLGTITFVGAYVYYTATNR